MRNPLPTFCCLASRLIKNTVALFMLLALGASSAMAQPAPEAGGEANLRLPDLTQVNFLGMDGHKLLSIGILFCVFGLIFGMAIYIRLKNLPVHRAMLEISELIYETCKTYLLTQGKFLLLLESFIAVIIILYFGVLLKFDALRVVVILGFSLLGIAGSYGVAWFGIRVNTFANSRTAFASLRGKPYPVYAIPLEAGMSIGMMLISVELLIMLFILLWVPADYAGSCFIGFAIGESLGAAALRIAGGIFTKIADIGSDLMKIVFKIKEDDARNPGVIADCTGDNAGDSVGPSADGFETYGVTGVALITFILLGVKDPTVQVQLLVWIFVMRVAMLVASTVAYFINAGLAKARYAGKDEMNFEAPADFPGLDHFHRLHPSHLPDFVHHYSSAWRRFHAMVEAGQHHLVRNSCRCGYTRTSQGLYFYRVAARKRSCYLGPGGRSITGDFVGLCSRKLQRLLSRRGHGDLDVDRLLLQHHGIGGSRNHDCGSGLRVWLGSVWIPRHGPSDNSRRFLRARH